MAAPEIQIVYECADFAVVEKPEGLAIHNNESSLGLVSLLRDRQAQSNYYPVHRLDEPTSGLIVFAKNRATNRELSLQFEARQVSKLYWAISDKKPQKKQGAIIGDMKRSRSGSWILTRSREKPAHTHFYSFSIGQGLRAFLLKPYSGKTHQLRVALKSIGAPILGDMRYGGAKSDRLHLHASYLSFRRSNEVFQFYSFPKRGEVFLTTAFQELCRRDDLLPHSSWPKR